LRYDRGDRKPGKPARRSSLTREWQFPPVYGATYVTGTLSHVRAQLAIPNETVIVRVLGTAVDPVVDPFSIAVKFQVEPSVLWLVTEPQVIVPE
jgi:hypothetical protein